MTDDKPKLIYVGDPMCSWCYGIAEELTYTVDHYNGKVELELIMGGLRAGGGEEWNQQFKDFLKHHWEDVGIRSGQPFKFELLEWDEFNYDTEPACRSVVTVQSMNNEQALPFFKEVQKGFYLENRDPNEAIFYKPICEKMGIDYAQFETKFNSDEMKMSTQKDFQRSQQIGVRSFPTILIENKGKVHIVASGYSTFAKMKEKIDAVIG